MAEYEHFVDHGVRWAVRPAVRPALFGPQGFRLSEWIASGAAEVIKSGPARTVYRVCLPDQKVIVKVYRLPSAGEVVRHLVRPSKGRREWRQAQAVAERHIPTVQALALGERYRLGVLRENYLVTALIEDSQPLDRFLTEELGRMPRPRHARLRRRVSEALADLAASAHQAGVFHTDFHPGNILVRVGADDTVSLYLIDLHAVKTGRPMGRRRVLRNLVQLNLYFSQVATRTDRWRFLRRYGEHLKDQDRAGLARLARRIEAATQRACRRFWAGRDRRAVGNNKYFYYLEVGRAHGQAVTDLDPERFAALLADPDESFRNPGVRRLKEGDNSTVVHRVLALRDGDVPVIYKRFNPRPWHTAVSAAVRGSRAWRAWRAAHALRVRGLPTPRPIAALEVCRFGRIGESYLLVEEMPGARNLADFVAQELACLSEPARERLKRQVIERLAALIGRLHRLNLDQRDLKAANILVSRTPGAAGSEIRLALVDLEDLRIRRRLPWGRRVQNLARLHTSFHDHPLVTRTDKLRFLLRYRQAAGGAAGADWKRLWRDVAAATQRKIAQNQRRGRVIT